MFGRRSDIRQRRRGSDSRLIVEYCAVKYCAVKYCVVEYCAELSGERSLDGRPTVRALVECPTDRACSNGGYPAANWVRWGTPACERGVSQ